MRIYAKIPEPEIAALRKYVGEYLVSEEEKADALLLCGKEDEVVSALEKGKNVITISPFYREDLVDAVARKNSLFVLGPIGPLFSVWQIFAAEGGGFEVYSGRIPLHESYWAPFIPVPPVEEFLARLKEIAYEKDRGSVVGVSPLARRKRLILRLYYTYEVEATNFCFASRYMLSFLRQAKARFWLLGRKGLISDLSALLRYGVLKNPTCLARRFSGEEEDVVLLRFVREDEAWTIEVRYNYSSRLSAHSLLLAGVLKLLLERFNENARGLIWPLRVFRKSEVLDDFLAFVKKIGGFILYRKFTKVQL